MQGDPPPLGETAHQVDNHHTFRLTAPLIGLRICRGVASVLIFRGSNPQWAAHLPPFTFREASEIII